ncbi:MAG: 30S ribosomal protein S1 [Holophagales bacterium]|jgi:small subunit ribosomal protein S1|nr:30S ribosomal protein S1 [Holophagales bacterium]
MSKLNNLIKGMASKQVGRIKVLDASLVDDDSPESQEFLTALQGETRALKEDEVVKGVVVEIRGKDVIVDIGYKGSGTINLDEFQSQDSAAGIQVGDVVEVLVEHLEDARGNVRLSRDRAEKMKIWDEVEKAFRANLTVHGVVLEKVKGGLAVDIGIRAFLPGSQVDSKPVRNLDQYLGKSFDMKVIKVNRRRGNIVLSRKLFMETINATLKEETLSGLEEGKLVEGQVKNITEYGAFIDLGGVDGLLHITDMSWGRLNHPAEMFHVGDKIEVAVLKYDRDSERVSLGYKQKFPDPWLTVEERFPLNSMVKGKVVSITDYGAFVELEPGVEGLVHVSEMSWTKKVKSAKGMVNMGDVVEAQILQIDTENRRISLGMKQVTPNPWMSVTEKYQPGQIVTGTVRNITEFGAFIELEEGIDGLIHVSDFSWTKKIKHPSEIIKKGDTLTAKVLNLDPLSQRMSLGVKQMEPNVWEIFFEKHQVGDPIVGKVARLTDFGAFVDLGDGIEGLVHVSELSRKRIEDVNKEFTIGQELTMKIVKLDPSEHRIGLSVKQLELDQEQSDVDAAKAAGQPFQKATLADAFARAEREE